MFISRSEGDQIHLDKDKAGIDCKQSFFAPRGKNARTKGRPQYLGVACGARSTRASQICRSTRENRALT